MLGIEFLTSIQKQSGKYYFKNSTEKPFKEIALDQVVAELLNYQIQTDKPSTIEIQNTELLVDFLLEISSYQSITSVHSSLDDLMAFKAWLKDLHIYELLEKYPKYLENRKMSARTWNHHVSIYNSFGEFLERKTGKTVTINRSRKRDTKESTQLLPNDSFLQLNPITITEYTISDLLRCLTGIRMTDEMSLMTDEIFVTDQIYIKVLSSKGKKSLTAKSMKLSLKNRGIICRLLEKRRSSGNNFLFSFGILNNNAGYQKARYYTKKITGLNTHGMRRLFANIMRALGFPILEIANSIFHSSTRTTAENYILIYPALQREQLINWVNNQKYLVIPKTISMKTNIQFNQVSCEGFKKMVKINSPEYSTNVLTLDQSIEIMENRIRASLA